MGSDSDWNKTMLSHVSTIVSKYSRKCTSLFFRLGKLVCNVITTPPPPKKKKEKKKERKKEGQSKKKNWNMKKWKKEKKGGVKFNLLTNFKYHLASI